MHLVLLEFNIFPVPHKAQVSASAVGVAQSVRVVVLALHWFPDKTWLSIHLVHEVAELVVLKL